MIVILERLRKAQGVRRLLLAGIAGAFAATALPPLYLWPFLFLAVPAVLSFLEDTKPGEHGRAFALGWALGFGYFILAFHWIGFAFLVNAKDYLWMMPFAVGSLAAAMAIYWGIAFAGVHVMGLKGLPHKIACVIALSLAEYLRGILFTGFPWASPGLSLEVSDSLLQTASIWGAWGFTLLVLLWAASWPVLFRKEPKSHRITAFIFIALLPLSALWGEVRLRNASTQNVASVNVRIVQPNISQDDKWRGENMRPIFDQLLEMSARPSTNDQPVTHIIWPESAVPFLVDESQPARAEIAAMLKPGKVLLTGTLRRDEKTAEISDDDTIYNTILGFDELGDVVTRYDKWRLVPGGEFLPFEWLLQPLGFRKVVKLPGSFAAGIGPVTLDVPNAPLAGLSICYEAIFADYFVEASNRPAWLVNITNDGWFGNSTGPYQHLAHARTRTVEQGMPLVRAANTGVSAIIDSHGRYAARLEVGRTGIIDYKLPAAIESTLFARFGVYIFFLMLAVFGMTLLRLKRNFK